LQTLSAERSGPSRTDRTVAVVGGGFAGLLAAREIAKLTAARIVLHEADERFGGKVLTTDVDGIQVEAGPDSFLDRDTDTVAGICRSVGLKDELISPAVFGGRVWVKGRLATLPSPSLYGMPTTPQAALACTALSMRGRMRAAAEQSIPRFSPDGDVSVGDFVRRRFGDEVLDRLVDPLLAGTRAGDVNEMSLAAALTQVYEIAVEHGSVMRGGASDMSEQAPQFKGLRSGMQSLIEALRRNIGMRVELRYGDRIETLIDRGDYYDLVSSTGRLATADHVVLCVPAFVASKLLRGVDDRLAQTLEGIEYASSASVGLTYRPESVPVPAGASGILVPSAEEKTISGCTFFTTKWPHVAPGDERQLVRCFVGRSGKHRALDLDDYALAAAVHDDLKEITGVASEPIGARVTRWERSLPQYRVGHPTRMDMVSGLLEGHPRLALAGAGYWGSGLPDVARGVYRAVARIVGASGQPDDPLGSEDQPTKGTEE
jgi:protoporphyrinogen/coproporphyrinogen III oxidase